MEYKYIENSDIGYLKHRVKEINKNVNVNYYGINELSRLKNEVEQVERKIMELEKHNEQKATLKPC